MQNNKIGLSPKVEPKFNITLSNGAILSDPKAIRSTITLMNQHAILGGAAAHWGGPSAFCEINSVLFSIFFKEKNHPWSNDYNFVNDAGHCENGIYAQHANYGFNDVNFDSLRGFRSIESKFTGHGEGHLYPEGVLISNGPLGSALPQAQGLSASDKLLKNNRLTVVTISDGASMEGEAKESFSAIPGLSAQGKMNPFVMIVSDNDTKLSGRISNDSYSQNGTFNSLESLGWKVIKISDGHDLETLNDVINQSFADAKSNPSQPIAIIAKTIKGKGVKSTEDSSSGGHGHPLKSNDEKLIDFIKSIYGDQEVPSFFTNWAQELIDLEEKKNKIKHDTEASGPKVQKVQIGVSEALIDLKNQGLPIVSITSDLAGSTGVANFQKSFPELTFDVGVAESNMVSMASGFSKNGFIPVVDTFAQFGVTKGNLPLIMANINEAPIVAIFSHTGFQDAADGASHQSTTYLSAVSSIPNTKVFCCSCSDQIKKLIKRELTIFNDKKNNGETPQSLVFFLGRENYPEFYPTLKDQKQSKIALICVGPMVSLGLKAKEELLKQDDIEVTVYDLSEIKPANVNYWHKELQNKEHIFTLEDHQIIGGAGSILSTQLENKYKINNLGINGAFGRSAYKAIHLYENMEFSPEHIVKKIKGSL